MKHLFYRQMHNAKNREASGVSYFTILSVNHCFLYLFLIIVHLTKNCIARSAQSNTSVAANSRHTPNESVAILAGKAGKFHSDKFDSYSLKFCSPAFSK